MQRHAWRRVLAIVSFSAIASCAGGGGCAGCGTPIPGGFPRESVVTNAGAVRITRPGLDVFATGAPAMLSKTLELPNGVFTIEIPKADTNGSIDLPWPLPDIDYAIHICPNGAKRDTNPPECIGEVAIGQMKLHIDAEVPNTVRASGTIPVRLRHLPVRIDNDGPSLGDFGVGLGAGGCNGDTPNFDYKEFPFQIAVPLTAETTPPRDGYTKLDWDRAVVDVQIGKGDVSVCKDCGVITELCNAVFDFVKDQAFNSLIGGVKDQLKQAMASQFCQKPNLALNPPCPTGTHAGGDHCVFDANPNACVPLSLGTDLRVDLSGALASVSPRTHGGLDFLLAAGGPADTVPNLPPDGNPYPGHTPNGLTLSLSGGALAAPQSDCVPKANLEPPKYIPVPDALRQDAPDANLQIALAGRFLEYLFGSAYNSGLLCLSITTEQQPQLQSGLLSLLVPSLSRLTFENRPAAVALTTRPQRPPTLQMGGGSDLKTDPLLAVGLPEFALDVYIWSLDRFVRVLTFTGDLTIPINLQMAKDTKTGLLPIIGDVRVEKAKVTNADLLSEDPARVALALGPVLGGFVSQLSGSIGVIDLGSMVAGFGLALDVPAGGIRKISQPNHDFVGIFANVSVPATSVAETNTEAHIVDRTVHPEAMGLTTLSREKRPTLHAVFSSPLSGDRAVEYSWAIDRGARSAWSTATDVTVATDDLVFQGKHALRVWSRYVGQSESEDPTPASVPFTIDTLGPRVEVSSRAGRVALRAWDFVSEEADLVARYRTADGKDGAWMPLAELAKTGSSDAVTVEVRDEAGNVSSRPLQAETTAATSGCGCSTPGDARGRSGTGAWALAAAGALLLMAWRRRQRSALGLGALAVAAMTNQGCSCGSDADDDGQTAAGCGADCKSACEPALSMGQVGAYTSTATAKDGSLWVAGYNDGIYSESADHRYGDLVVGRYDTAKQRVMWSTVDGVPARTDATCPTADRNGWRGGETEAGDNVGLWTSVQLDANENPMVAYYDATHRRLKFARFDGQNWSNYVLREGGDSKSDTGRYAKLILWNGKPVVAFSQNEQLGASDAGFVRSKIVVAKATGPSPTGAADWTFEDAAVDDKVPASANPPASVETYPNAIGNYIRIAAGPQGLGIVAYDRVHRRLIALSNGGTGPWTSAVLDDTADVGVGASLAISDNGDWHVTYADALHESLRYLRAPGGPRLAGDALVREIVDDGLGLGAGAPRFVDGRHLVGDDSFVRATGDRLQVTYQDATAGVLRLATGTANGQGGYTWAVAAIPQPGRFAGFFPSFAGNGIVHFWRQYEEATVDGIVGDVTWITP